MSRVKLTVTTKTKAQIKADFAQAFKNIQPEAKAGPVTQKQRLEPYREEIMRQRKRGLQWNQIAVGMSPPPISETVSPKLLRDVFGPDEAAQPERLVIDPVTGQPVLPVAKQQPQRLIIDPVTGQPVLPTKPDEPNPRIYIDAATNEVHVLPDLITPPPQPITTEEHQRYDELLKGLIPPIVKTKMNRAAAWNYGSRAVERSKPAEVARFKQILELELDGLNESNCSRYGVPPEMIAPWRWHWNRSR